MAYGVSTQWDDIHIKLGNYAKKENKVSQAKLTKKALDRLDNYNPLDSKNIDELRDMEEEFMNDDFFKDYQKQRINELKHIDLSKHYGSVYEISKQDYQREINDASEESAVILHLYQPFIRKCNLLNKHF